MIALPDPPQTCPVAAEQTGRASRRSIEAHVATLRSHLLRACEGVVVGKVESLRPDRLGAWAHLVLLEMKRTSVQM